LSAADAPAVGQRNYSSSSGEKNFNR